MGGGGGGVMNWETGIDMYTVMCIKWMTNKNLQYKKINKIKFKNSKKKENPKDSIKNNLLNLINEFSKVVEYKINIQKSVASLLLQII